MATYAIGDVQGCWQALARLLDHIHFDESADQLWFAGDLLNRGPQSLEVCRFVHNLKNVKVVLGNHDLHFLALHYTDRFVNKYDTLTALLKAPDCDDLAQWLCQQPLLHFDENYNAVMVHAGIPPQWSLTQARGYAEECSQILQDATQRVALFENMYADEPTHWQDDLSGWPRVRLIINFLTRMRFIDAQGDLNLDYKGELDGAPAELTPWFACPRAHPLTARVLFGHWAALLGKCSTPNMWALDGGCVWGHQLMALRLEDNRRFAVNHKA